MWIQTKIIARPVFIGFRYDAGGTSLQFLRMDSSFVP